MPVMIKPKKPEPLNESHNERDEHIIHGHFNDEKIKTTNIPDQGDDGGDE